MGRPEGDEFTVSMPDGRVALLFCPVCFDLGCASLPTDVIRRADIVEWRDIAWQVDYEPLDLTESEFAPPTLRLGRTHYDAELTRLLSLERGGS